MRTICYIDQENHKLFYLLKIKHSTIKVAGENSNQFSHLLKNKKWHFSTFWLHIKSIIIKKECLIDTSYDFEKIVKKSEKNVKIEKLFS